MNLAIGIGLVIAGYILFQWTMSGDALSKPLWLSKPTGIIMTTTLCLLMVVGGLYFLYKVTIWIPIIIVGLLLLLIASNLLFARR